VLVCVCDCPKVIGLLWQILFNLIEIIIIVVSQVVATVLFLKILLFLELSFQSV